jgi:hypothetical protein
MALELAQVAVTAGTLTLGAGIAFVADWRKNGWAARRERDAAARQDERERRAFERATLIELQDALAKLVRVTSTAYYATSAQEVRLVEEELREAHANVFRLAVRAADDTIRDEARELDGFCAIATLAAGRSEGDPVHQDATNAWHRAIETNGTLNTRIGDRLRAVT